MSLGYHRFCPALILCVLSVLPLTTHAQPNTTIEIPQPQPVRNGVDRKLALTTWDELEKQIGGPTLVSLHAEKMTPLQIIEALNQQVTVPVSAYDASSERWKADNKIYSANYDAQPLWSVARDLAKQMKINIKTSDEGVEFAHWIAEKSSLVTNSGPAIFVLNEVNYQGLLGTVPENEDKPVPRETLQLEGKVYLDPKVPWMSEQMSLYLAEAVDENGQSLLLENESRLSINWQPIGLKISLRPRARQLKVLRGSVHGVVAAAAQTWEVEDVLNARNTEKIIGEGEKNTRLELQEVKKVGDDYHVVMVVSLNQKDVLALYRFMNLSTGKLVVIQNIFQDLRLLDDQGRALKKIKVDSQREGDKDTSIFTITAAFRPVESDAENLRTGPPTKFVLNYAPEYRELIVPFEFKDIPLP